MLSRACERKPSRGRKLRSNQARGGGGIAAKLRTNARELRSDRRWTARCNEFFTGPRFAVIKTVGISTSDLDTRESTACRGGEVPMISSNMESCRFLQAGQISCLSRSSLLRFLDIGQQIPSHNASLFISQRVVAEKEPQILPSFPSKRASVSCGEPMDRCS